MQPTLCARCKKNVAVVFISRMNEKNEQISEGLCLQCAAKLGLPQVEDMMKRMGITPEDLESLSSEMMQAFGGAEELEDMPEDESGEDEDESGKTATFPFLNRLFGGSQTPAEKQPAEGSGQSRDSKGGKTEKKRKFLDNYCINLSRRAREGKLDAVVIDDLVAKSLAAKNAGYKAIELVKRDGKGLDAAEEFGIMVAKGNEDLLAIINEVIEECKKNNFINDALLKHNDATKAE